MNGTITKTSIIKMFDQFDNPATAGQLLPQRARSVVIHYQAMINKMDDWFNDFELATGRIPDPDEVSAFVRDYRLPTRLGRSLR